MKGPLKQIDEADRQDFRGRTFQDADLTRLHRYIFLALIPLPVFLAFLPLLDPSIRIIDAHPVWAALGLSAIGLASFVFVAWTGRARLGIFMYICTMQIGLVWNLLQGESVHSVVYGLIPLYIIVAALLIGGRMAVFFSVFCVLTTVACIEFNATRHLPFPYKQDFEDFTKSNILTILLAQMIVLIMAWLHHNFRRQKQRAITMERRKISESLHSYALGELVGSISHEINNPLAIMSSLLIQLERSHTKDLDSVSHERLHEKLDRAVQRIRYIVNGLKMFAEGELQEELQPTAVAAICEQLEMLNQEKFIQSSIVFSIVDLTENITFPSRFQQLFRALNGLLNNAVEAVSNRQDAKVVLKISCENDFVVFEISDNGHGIPEELRDHVFEPFFSTKVLQPGQGLTLALSRGLIEAQGGKLLYTPLPIGSSFSIWLPLHAPRPRSKHESSVPGISQTIEQHSFGNSYH